jgi:DNA-binding LacI/PurR family transcriptional regulator
VWLDSTVWHEHNCIQRDEVAAGEYAGRALAEAGYRKWIYMDRPNSSQSYYCAAGRRAGVMAAADQAKANLRIVCHDLEEELGSEFMQRLTPQIGLILGNPYFISEVARAEMRARRCAGKDFALVCVDEGFTTAGYSWEALSHVRFPASRWGCAPRR